VNNDKEIDLINMMCEIVYAVVKDNHQFEQFL